MRERRRRFTHLRPPAVAPQRASSPPLALHQPDAGPAPGARSCRHLLHLHNNLAVSLSTRTLFCRPLESWCIIGHLSVVTLGGSEQRPTGQRHNRSPRHRHVHCPDQGRPPPGRYSPATAGPTCSRPRTGSASAHRNTARYTNCPGSPPPGGPRLLARTGQARRSQRGALKRASFSRQ